MIHLQAAKNNSATAPGYYLEHDCMHVQSQCEGACPSNLAHVHMAQLLIQMPVVTKRLLQRSQCHLRRTHSSFLQ